jgi:tetratricopeptide (TPR) repeat protein
MVTLSARAGLAAGGEDLPMTPTDVKPPPARKEYSSFDLPAMKNSNGEDVGTFESGDSEESALNWLNKQIAANADATRLVQRALIYVKRGDTKSAVADLKRAIAMGTPSEDPTELLVLIYMRGKEFDKAEAAGKEFLAKNPKGIRIWIVMSRLYAEEGKVNDAAKSIDKAIAIDPKNADLYMLKAAIYGKNKDYEKTMRAIEDGLKAAPNDKLLLFSQAYAHETMSKDSKLAIKELDDLIAKYPDFFKAQEERAAIEFDLQNYAAAKKLYGEMIEKISVKEKVQPMQIIQKTASKQELLEGVQAALESVPLGALLTKCLNAKAYCELELGEFDDATRDNFEAIIHAPQNARFRILQSNICLASGRASEAQAYMEDALELTPDDGTTYFSQGYNFLAKEQFPDALKAFVDALARTKDTEFPAAYCYLYKAQLERILDKAKEADDTLQKASTTLKLSEWPGPIIQYLMGKKSAEGLNKDASDKGKQTEMHFALALEDMANKNDQKTLDELHWVQSAGEPSFMETWTARAMLKYKK